MSEIIEIKQKERTEIFQERTEEKKKIFEMAGGGKAKKPLGVERSSKKTPKKPGQYLPDVEQKRREPWRFFNGVSDGRLASGIKAWALFRRIRIHPCA